MKSECNGDMRDKHLFLQLALLWSIYLFLYLNMGGGIIDGETRVATNKKIQKKKG